MLHLQQVFDCFRTAGITAKLRKCAFGRAKLKYLGHEIGGGTLAVPQLRDEAMENFVKPHTKRQLRAFLGSVGYYRQFIPYFADYSSVLTPATTSASPSKLRWSPEMDEAFSTLCKSLSNSVTLYVPSLSDTFTLSTDASGTGLGACLHVIRDDEQLPVAFYSRQLRGAEKKHTITELESLAIVCAVKHFDYYLYGSTFTVYTDHKACEALLNDTPLNPRLSRFALYLQDKHLTIQYKPGADNGNADGLSRQGWPSQEDLVSFPLSLICPHNDDGDITISSAFVQTT